MKNGKLLVIVGSVCLLVGLVSLSADPVPRSAPGGSGIAATVTPAVNGVVPEAVGTITYDNNVPFQRDGQTDAMVGNRFQPNVDPHTLTSVSFRVAGNYGASVVASVWEAGAGTASLLRRWLVLGVPSGGGATAATVSVPVGQRVGTTTMVSPITGHSGTFMAGIHNSFYTGFACASAATALNTTCDGVALTAGTAGTNFHGVRIQLADGVFIPTVTNVMTTGVDIAQNAIMRATGESLPVELMSFTIGN